MKYINHTKMVKPITNMYPPHNLRKLFHGVRLLGTHPWTHFLPYPLGGHLPQFGFIILVHVSLSTCAREYFNTYLGIKIVLEYAHLRCNQTALQSKCTDLHSQQDMRILCCLIYAKTGNCQTLNFCPSGDYKMVRVEEFVEHLLHARH